MPNLVVQVGYAQRARFYGGISAHGRLQFAKGIASYILFLADTTGQASSPRAAQSLRAALHIYSLSASRFSIEHNYIGRVAMAALPTGTGPHFIQALI